MAPFEQCLPETFLSWSRATAWGPEGPASSLLLNPGGAGSPATWLTLEEAIGMQRAGSHRVLSSHSGFNASVIQSTRGIWQITLSCQPSYLLFYKSFIILITL